MHVRFGVLFLLLFLFLPTVGAAQWQHTIGPSGRFIVLLKERERGELGRVLEELSVPHLQRFEHLGGFAGVLSVRQRMQLRLDPRVELIEPDYEVEAFDQSVPTGIERSGAISNETARIDGLDDVMDVDIAIIDTGISLSHPDLAVYRNVNFIQPWKSGDDDNGHGSHVAGTAAARDNDTGVVGVAPGARLWALKVLNRNGTGYTSDIVEAIDYVTAHADEIDVVNMSLGCECSSSTQNEAIKRSVAAGVVYVVAAGNSAKDAATFNPANQPDVIAVSAIADFNGQPGGGAASTCRVDVDDTFADFSNYGSVVDIAAPGVCIYSTWKGSSYNTISGTSMAAPHVAGAAALYIVKNGKPTHAAGVAGVKAELLANAWLQTSAQGFTEDPDTFHEPLLNVSWTVQQTSSASSDSSVSVSSASSISSSILPLSSSSLFSSSSSLPSSSSSIASSISSDEPFSSSASSLSSSSSSSVSSSSSSSRFKYPPWWPWR